MNEANEASSNSVWLALPEPLFLKIFYFLDYDLKTFLSLQLVCKKWKTSISTALTTYPVEIKNIVEKIEEKYNDTVKMCLESKFQLEPVLEKYLRYLIFFHSKVGIKQKKEIEAKYTIFHEKNSQYLKDIKAWLEKSYPAYLKTERKDSCVNKKFNEIQQQKSHNYSVILNLTLYWVMNCPKKNSVKSTSFILKACWESLKSHFQTNACDNNSYNFPTKK